MVNTIITSFAFRLLSLSYGISVPLQADDGLIRSPLYHNGMGAAARSEQASPGL